METINTDLQDRVCKRWHKGHYKMRKSGIPICMECARMHGKVKRGVWDKAEPFTLKRHPDVRARFLDHVTRFGGLSDHRPDLGECWIFNPHLPYDGKSYTCFVDPDTGKNNGAHRFSYECFVGPIPEGLHLDHLCRRRNCVNPWHLEPVTSEENTRRSINGELRTHCKSAGHPYTSENTYITPAGYRACKVCRRERDRERQEKFIALRAERGKYKRYANGESAIGHTRRDKAA